jgi:hypothetical protein
VVVEAPNGPAPGPCTAVVQSVSVGNTNGLLVFTYNPGAPSHSFGLVARGRRSDIAGGAAGVITSVTPDRFDARGGMLLTITGTNLGSGSDITSARIGGVFAPVIVSQTASEVVVVAGALPYAGLKAAFVGSVSFGNTAAFSIATALPGLLLMRCVSVSVLTVRCACSD